MNAKQANGGAKLRWLLSEATVYVASKEVAEDYSIKLNESWAVPSLKDVGINSPYVQNKRWTHWTVQVPSTRYLNRQKTSRFREIEKEWRSVATPYLKVKVGGSLVPLALLGAIPKEELEATVPNCSYLFAEENVESFPRLKKALEVYEKLQFEN